ncbi:unnamed protein product, partial [Linum tenue]
MKNKSRITTSGSSRSTNTKSTRTQTDEYPSVDKAFNDPDDNNKCNGPHTDIPGSSRQAQYAHLYLLPVFIWDHIVVF